MIEQILKPCDAGPSATKLGDDCGAGNRYSMW
jgi:hypothetical protein